MFWEIQTGHNPYALLGGAKAKLYANILERDNRFRAMGCFGGPITAGTFGAIVAPLFVTPARAEEIQNHGSGGNRGNCGHHPNFELQHSDSCLCGRPDCDLSVADQELDAGDPLGDCALPGVCPFGVASPVWYLIAKVDISGGSFGHRFTLIDQCVRHFGDWWLVGVKSTAEWGWDMWDTANQYVGTCDASGLLPFILFLSILVYGFKYLGKARRRASDKKERLFLGVGSLPFRQCRLVLWHFVLGSDPGGLVRLAGRNLRDNRNAPKIGPPRVSSNGTKQTVQWAPSPGPTASPVTISRWVQVSNHVSHHCPVSPPTLSENPLGLAPQPQNQGRQGLYSDDRGLQRRGLYREDHPERSLTDAAAARWVIVSDHSTDRTDQIVQSYADKHDFIRFLRVTKDAGHSFRSKVVALHKGAKLLEGVDHDFIGNLDADISLEDGLLRKIGGPSPDTS